MLTKRMADTLYFIADYQATHDGVSPSLDDIAAGIGIKSKSSAHRMIHELEARGFIRQMPHHARSLEILRLPNLPSAAFPADAPPFVNSAVTWLQERGFRVVLTKPNSVAA